MKKSPTPIGPSILIHPLILFAALFFSFATVHAGDGDTTTVVERKPEGISEEEWEKLKAKRPLPFDNGPATIDVSAYPKQMQDIYANVFSMRCSKCHTIARPINAPYALPEEWNRYIKKMMKKPGSGITPDAGKRIYQFLVYDSEVRKKDAIEKKLREKAASSQGGDKK